MPDLLMSLKERKVVQWALAYLLGAWLVVPTLPGAVHSFALPAPVLI